MKLPHETQAPPKKKKQTRLKDKRRKETGLLDLSSAAEVRAYLLLKLENSYRAARTKRHEKPRLSFSLTALNARFAKLDVARNFDSRARACLLRETSATTTRGKKNFRAMCFPRGTESLVRCYFSLGDGIFRNAGYSAEVSSDIPIVSFVA